MSQSGLLVLFVVALLLILVAAGFAAARRTQGMKAFAAAHGLTYLGSAWELGDCGFPLFTRGNSRRWSHVMRGTWQTLPVLYTDYQYTVQQGRNSETFRFSAVVLDLPLATPQVEVAPRGLLGRLVEDVGGGSGLQFESADFNHRYSVQCADPRFAYALIDARMMEALLQLEAGVYLTFGSIKAMVWSKRRPLRSLESLCNAAATVVQHVPEMVRREYGGFPPVPGAVG